MAIVGSFKIKKGLDLPVVDTVLRDLDKNLRNSKYIALKGRDFVGMKPTLLVKEGDKVKIGEPLFSDKKNEGVIFTSPAGGVVKNIHRGEKREFLSIVVERDDKEEEVTFKSYDINALKSLSSDIVRDSLLKSGQWVFLRRRPFDSIAGAKETPRSIFVSAMDSNPYGFDTSLLVDEKEEIEAGCEVLSKLTSGFVNFCSYENSPFSVINHPKVKHYEFSGKHPAGLVGTHIHHIDPVSFDKFVWHISLSNLVAIGKFFLTGKISLERIVSLGGTLIREGKHIKTRLGAFLPEIISEDLLKKDNTRIISGSILSGTVSMDSVFGYLGAYDNSITVIEEETNRVFLGMHSPGFNLFSTKNIFVSSFLPGKKFRFNTNKHGGHRAIFSLGTYEDVMPLDIEATFLLRALASKDIEGSISLGALELGEEDLSLCTFVCPGKNDHGLALRQMLELIQKEG